jgi:hypothetical protein
METFPHAYMFPEIFVIGLELTPVAFQNTALALVFSNARTAKVAFHQSLVQLVPFSSKMMLLGLILDFVIAVFLVTPMLETIIPKKGALVE